MGALGRLRVESSKDVLRASESCNEGKSGALFSCYTCIHQCKRKVGCYQNMGPVQTAYNVFASAGIHLIGQSCWVADAPCSCASEAAVQSVETCMRSCSG